jgi:DNA-binding CsgD family transcriptional regulator
VHTTGKTKPTARELEVLQLAIAGLSDERIADCLCVSAATVRKHIQNVCTKLGADNRCHLTALAISEGFLHPRPRGRSWDDFWGRRRRAHHPRDASFSSSRL